MSEDVSKYVLSRRILMDFIRKLCELSEAPPSAIKNIGYTDPITTDLWEAIKVLHAEVIHRKVRDRVKHLGFQTIRDDITTYKRWFGTVTSSVGAPIDVCRAIILLTYDIEWEDIFTHLPKADHPIPVDVWLQRRQQSNKNGNRQSYSITESLDSYFERHHVLNDDSFSGRYFEDDYFKMVKDVMTSKNKCLIIAHMGNGKTTLLSRYGKDLIVGGNVVRYISMGDHTSIDSKDLYDELKLCNASKAYLFVDDCHDNPYIASQIVSYCERLDQVKLVLSARPATNRTTAYQQRALAEFTTMFSADEKIQMTVTKGRLASIVGKYQKVHGNEGVELTDPKEMLVRCGANLKLLDIYLDTWRDNRFEGKLTELDPERVYLHLLAEYNYNEGLNPTFINVLKVAVLSQFDLWCYHVHGYLNPSIEDYAGAGRIRREQFNESVNYLKRYRMPHATIGLYLLEGVFRQGGLPNGSLAEYEEVLLLEYLQAITQNTKNANLAICINVFVLFSRMQGDGRIDLIRSLIITADFKGYYKRMVVITGRFNPEEVGRILPELFGFLSLTKEVSKEDYEHYYFAVLVSALPVHIIAEAVNNKHVDHKLLISILEVLSDDKEYSQQLVNEVDWRIFGELGLNDIGLILRLFRKTYGVLKECNIPFQQRQQHLLNLQKGYNFWKFGKEAQGGTYSKIPYAIKGIADANLATQLNSYLQGLTYETLGEKMGDLVRRVYSGEADSLPVYYFPLTHLDRVMTASDVEDFVNGFTWETLNCYINNYVSFDVVAVIESILSKRYSENEIYQNGIRLSEARFKSLINHPLCQIRLSWNKEAYEQRQQELLDELRPKFLEDSTLVAQFTTISTMTDMNVFIANAYDIGLPIYQKLIHQEFCEEFDSSLEKWLKPATLRETGIYLSYFAKGSNKRIPWKLPRRMDLDQINVDDKIKTASVIDFVYFEIHLINYLDENDTRIYYLDAQRFLKQHYDVSKPEELLDKLKNEKVGTISFFLSPAYRLDPDETEQLLKHEGFNDFIVQIFEQEENIEIKDILGLAGMYMLYNLPIPFSIPRSVNSYTIDDYKDKKVDHILNGGGMVSPRVITAMNRLHPAGLANRYLKHAEEVINTNLFSDVWKSLFVEQIYAQAKVDLEEA